MYLIKKITMRLAFVNTLSYGIHLGKMKLTHYNNDFTLIIDMNEVSCKIEPVVIIGCTFNILVKAVKYYLYEYHN